MRNPALGLALKTASHLLRVAPHLSAVIAGWLAGSKGLARFKARPRMIRRIGNALLGKGPLISQLNVTNACNQRCRMCNLWHDGTAMDLATAMRCMDRIEELGSVILTITGGEPFMHPHIGEILAYAREKEFFININTNATVPLRIYRSVDMSAIDIGIVSFHSLDAATFDAITESRNALAKAMRTLAYFREHTDMRIILKFVVQRDNYREIERVYEFAEREGFTVEYHPVMVDVKDRPVTTKDETLLPDKAAHLECWRRVKNLKERGRNFESKGYYDFCIDTVERDDYRWDCDAGVGYLSVYADGTFGICKDIYTRLKITDDDFIERYRSAAFQKEMNTLRSKCRGCNWSCYVTASRIAAIARGDNVADLKLLGSL